MFKEEFSTFFRVLHGWGGGLSSFFSPVLMSDLWKQPTCAPPPPLSGVAAYFLRRKQQKREKITVKAAFEKKKGRKGVVNV